MSGCRIGRVRLKPTNVVSISNLSGRQLPDAALLDAVGQLESVVIVGLTPAGDHYLAGGAATRERMLWIIELARSKITGSVA